MMSWGTIRVKRGKANIIHSHLSECCRCAEGVPVTDNLDAE